MATEAALEPTTAQNVLTAEQLFDSVGPAYESAFANLTGQHASIEWIKKECSRQEPCKILDIGCGTGRPVCAALADAGHDVLGIDVSAAMIEDARSKVANAKFQKIDVADFDVPPGSFDVITVFFSMLASVSQDQIRENIRRIHGWLKPQGLFVYATVPIPGNLTDIKWMGRPLVVSSLSVDDSVDAVKAAGFEIVSQESSIFMPKAVEAGICEAEEIWEEPHLFVHARKT